MATTYVRPAGPRPDYRLVLSFAWGDDADCDTDGNARHPADRGWTELYAQNRSRPEETFDVIAACEAPLVLEVKSPVEWLAAAVAHLLAVETAGRVATDPHGPFTLASTLRPRLGDFDVEAAWSRYWGSPFQRATAENPYPNLNR
ncbi:hypothetical protein V5E97_08230 [Singulisphaera sp. Ch08]|uniref:Uncharacterized protein n=1 Tax=Singulisphaera sp. Ch08 TaxID=3120278 RepID=A0AAU7CKG7_9BACT